MDSRTSVTVELGFPITGSSYLSMGPILAISSAATSSLLRLVKRIDTVRVASATPVDFRGGVNNAIE